MKYLSVVIPVYNEVAALTELHQRLAKVLDPINRDYEIILIDDGSRDGSLAKLRELAAIDPRVVAIELSRNFGQTAALAAGIDYASGEVIVTLDGDLQHDPADIPRFLSKLEEGFDIVSGWREVRTDNYWIRRLPSRAANALMRWFSGMTVKDFGSTFKAYRAETVKRIELFGELHRFIPVLAHRLGARIVEIPIAVHPRGQGASNYGLSRVFGVFQDILFLEFYSNYLTKPIRAFGKLFLIFFGIGFLISAALMGLWAVGAIRAVLEHGALLLFSVFLMIVGVQFLVAGIFAELLTRIYLQTSNSRIYSIRKVHQQSLEPIMLRGGR